MKNDSPFEKLYIKTSKNKYEEVKANFQGFPSTGIFIVQRNLYSTGYCQIAKLEELNNLHIPTLAALNVRRDDAMRAISETMRSPCSSQDIFDAVAKAISQGDLTPEEVATRSFEKAIG